MTGRRQGVLFGLCLTLQGCILLGLSLAARSGCRPSSVVIALLACFVPYLGSLVFSRCVPQRRTLDLIAISTALLFGAALVLAPPLLSDDLYRYLWEGRIWLEGGNPYRTAPDDPALAHLRDGLWAQINNKPLASIYPPLSQLLFVVTQWLGGSVWALKLVALLAHVLCVASLALLSTTRRASLALAINPLLIAEAALNGHFDILCGLALLIVSWAMARQRIVLAAAATIVAVGLKVVGLVALPLFARRPKILMATAFASALLLLPLVWSRAPVDPSSGPGQFATRWRGNESVFALLDWLSRQVFDQSTSSLVARSLVVALFLVLCAIVARRAVPPLQGIRGLLWALLLLAPQVHPWYLAWLLPVELAAGGFAGLLWSAVVLCAYVPLDRWVAEGSWSMPGWLQVLEYSILALALVLDPRRPSLRSQPAESGIRG
ncbi:MAG: hypothetical protein WCE62_09050 [Polyangiales bacterium]